MSDNVGSVTNIAPPMEHVGFHQNYSEDRMGERKHHEQHGESRDPSDGGWLLLWRGGACTTSSVATKRFRTWLDLPPPGIKEKGMSAVFQSPHPAEFAIWKGKGEPVGLGTCTTR